MNEYYDLFFKYDINRYNSFDEVLPEINVINQNRDKPTIEHRIEFLFNDTSDFGIKFIID